MRSSRWPLYIRLGNALLAAISGLILFYLVVPTFVVVPISFNGVASLSFPPEGFSTQWYANLWKNTSYWTAGINSLRVGIVASILAMILGTLAALSVVRGQMAMARGFSALVLAPMMLPPIILAIGIFPILAYFRAIGGYFGVTVAHAVIGTPFVFITVVASLRDLGTRYEQAAMTLGANAWTTFWTVTFPMIRRGILLGGLFAFATSLDEVVMALFLTDQTSVTLAKFMFGEFRYALDPTIAAASTVVVGASLLLLAVIALTSRLGRRHRIEGERT